MKTVIEMAREAGFNKNELAYLGDNFTRFAELVRADEREACAKVCEDTYDLFVREKPSRASALDAATAIRARGTT